LLIFDFIFVGFIFLEIVFSKRECILRKNQGELDVTEKVKRKKKVTMFHQ